MRVHMTLRYVVLALSSLIASQRQQLNEALDALNL